MPNVQVWWIIVGVFILVIWFGAVSTANAGRMTAGLGSAGSIEQREGRGAIQGSIGCLGTIIVFLAGLGMVYTLLTRPDFGLPPYRLVRSEIDLRVGRTALTQGNVFVHADPLPQPSERMLIPHNTRVQVIGGPQEVDGVRWWIVRFGEIVGWVRELTDDRAPALKPLARWE